MRLGTNWCIGLMVATLSTAPAAAQPISMQGIQAEFGRYDINEDSILSGTETVECGCIGFDLDGDREISLAEFSAGSIISGRQRAGSSAPQSVESLPPPREAPTAAPERIQQAATDQQPPVGKYGCHFTRFGSIVPSGNMITILSPGTYRFYDRGSGQYTVAAGGALNWTSGPLVGSQVEGSFYRRTSDGKPTIKLLVKGIGKDHLGRSYDQTNYCIHHG